jgi:hypothetical protein
MGVINEEGLLGVRGVESLPAPRPPGAAKPSKPFSITARAGLYFLLPQPFRLSIAAKVNNQRLP